MGHCCKKGHCEKQGRKVELTVLVNTLCDLFYLYWVLSFSFVLSLQLVVYLGVRVKE